MATTPLQLLEQCETAISAILSGAQSCTVGGRSYSRANLSELHKMRKDLLAETANDRSQAAGMGTYKSRTFASNGGRL